MSSIDALFGSPSSGLGTTFGGYGDQPFMDRDSAIQSFLPEGGQVTFEGLTGSYREVLAKGQRSGWSPSKQREFVRKYGR